MAIEKNDIPVVKKKRRSPRSDPPSVSEQGPASYGNCSRRIGNSLFRARVAAIRSNRATEERRHIHVVLGQGHWPSPYMEMASAGMERGLVSLTKLLLIAVLISKGKRHCAMLRHRTKGFT
jgi:hypothetical protein